MRNLSWRAIFPQGLSIAILAATVFPFAASADHVDFVVINATASKAYTARKFVQGVAQPETYAFYEGRYFGGATHDLSIAHASFLDIAKVLAPNLAKRNYLPARDAKAADLLLVVNWGATSTGFGGKADPEIVFELQQDLTDVANFNAAAAKESGQAGLGSPAPPPGTTAAGLGAEVDMDRLTDKTNTMSAGMSDYSNAELLGYAQSLNKEMAMQSLLPDGLGAEAESHMSDLIEERYFIVLLAYDYQEMLSHGKATAPPKPVWEVRMNIRAAGNNFTEALPAMSKVAANYFGKQLDDLKTEQTDVSNRGRVEIGPVKILSIQR